jgi:hypothetical protein
LIPDRPDGPSGLDALYPAVRKGPGELLPVAYRWWEALIAYLLGSLFLGSIVVTVLGAVDDDASDLSVVVASAVAGLVFLGSLVVWLNRVHPGSWARIGIRWRPSDAGWGVVGGLMLYPLIAFALAWVVQQVLEAASGDEVTAPEQLSPDIPLEAKLVAVVLALLIAPVTEELFFRGILYRSVRDRYGIVLGITVSALAFGAVHYISAPIEDALLLQIVMVGTGVVLALLYEWRANLVTSIAAHMAFNTIGLSLIFWWG